MLLPLLACAEPKQGPDDSAEEHDASVEPIDDTSEESAEDSGTRPPSAGLRLSEVMSNNAGAVLDGGGDSPDWIELHNPSTSPVSALGWGLSDDEDEPYRFLFPEVEIAPGGFLIVWASGTASTGEELHAPFQLSSEGEEVVLTDPTGVLADRLDVPPLPEDTSYGPEAPVTTATLLSSDASVSWSLTPGAGWTTSVDTTWSRSPWPLGFDLGADTGTEELSLFAPAEQSSDGYGFTGAQATDGELSTISHTSDADLDPWLRIDLGETFAIGRATLYNRLDCCAERLYNVVVSVEDEAGATVWASSVLNPVSEGGAPTSPGASLVVDLPEDPAINGRYVRIAKTAVNGAGSSEWLSLAEVVVEGGAAFPYRAWIATDVAHVMYGVTDTLALTASFSAPEPAPTRTSLRIRYDDALRVSLDGALVTSKNLKGTGGAKREFEADEPIEVALPSLAPGSHVLAIEARNLSASDADFLVGGEVYGETFALGEPRYFRTSTPGAPNGVGFLGFTEDPIADPPRGFYDVDLTVNLRTATPGAVLVYTLDGSEPTLDHGTSVAGGPDGASTSLAVGTTTILRARAFADDYERSTNVAFTYLFLDDVIRQPAAPAGFPKVWYDPSQGSFAADYAMDPEIVDDPAYHDDLLAGLRAIPSLSIIVDPDDLFGDDRGIYIRSLERGADWERAAQLELLLPDGTSGFATRAGLRLHGYGWRYHSSTLKHAFRLEFSPDYGPSKLDYPLFEDAPVDRFDSIVLRSQGSRSWQDFRDPAQACYVRDAFARDLAAGLGKVDGHATYVHLYLNGLYWGLYMPVERPEAGFAEEYFGGAKADYDAINRRTSTNEAVDGTLDAYNELLAAVDCDLTNPAAYAEVEARLNIDDLIDYMLLQQYTVNRDGPCCFDHNNMRGIASTSLGVPFHFFLWDMEYSVWYAEDDTNVNIDVSGSASHMYARLRQSPTFRARYSERAALALAGAFAPDRAAASWELRASAIEDAVVAESARWGDATREPPYTRDVEWEAERTRLLTDFFPYRADQLAEQLEAAELYNP